VIITVLTRNMDNLQAKPTFSDSAQKTWFFEAHPPHTGCLPHQTDGSGTAGNPPHDRFLPFSNTQHLDIKMKYSHFIKRIKLEFVGEAAVVKRSSEKKRE
jgi:hypothetical protein